MERGAIDSPTRALVIKDGRAHTNFSTLSPGPLKILTRDSSASGGFVSKRQDDFARGQDGVKGSKNMNIGGGSGAPCGPQSLIRPPEETEMRKRDATSMEKRNGLAFVECRERERNISHGASTRPN